MIGCDFLVYTFDTETSYDGNRAWVWSWGLLSEDGDYTTGNGTDFLNRITTIGNATVWVHNLSFDGEFIICELVNAGFSLQYEMDRGDKHRVFVVNEDMTGILSITVAVAGAITVFRDSLRLFRMPLRDLPQLCGSDITKTAMDDGYKNRPLDHNKTVDEHEYQYIDCVVLMNAVKWCYSNPETRGNTIGSIALNDWKKRCGKSPFKPLTPDQRHVLAPLYKGGCATVNPKYYNRRLDGVRGVCYDVNSMYPDKLQNEKLPVAIRYWKNGMTVGDQTSAHHVLISGAKLKPGMFPVLITPFTGTGRTEFLELDTWLFDFELAELSKHYTINRVSVLESVAFDTEKISNGFVEHWYEIKRSAARKPIRNFSKLMLNNLTGKLAQVDDREIIQRRFAGGDLIRVHCIEPAEKTNAWAFMPATAYITALSRRQLAHGALLLDDWYYTDTDSVHGAGELPAAMVDASALGKWACEGEFTSALYIKSKCYWERGEHYYTQRHAGIMKNAVTACGNFPISWQNMRSGQLYKTNQMKTVEGGAAIVEIKKYM